MRAARVIRAGRVPYAEGLALQGDLEARRLRGEISDTIVVLEHDPVITLGHKGDATNVVAAPAALESRGIEVHRISRGGDVTYHGPGQVVMYPIVSLHEARKGPARFVEILEETMIRTAADHGVEVARLPQKRGVFTVAAGDKLGAVGIHISHGVTTHGLALNVEPDLSHFDLIVPCGLREHAVTSLARELGRAVDQAGVEEQLIGHFAELMGYELENTP